MDIFCLLVCQVAIKDAAIVSGNLFVFFQSLICHVGADLVDLLLSQISALVTAHAHHGCSLQIAQGGLSADGVSCGNASCPAGIVVSLRIEVAICLRGGTYPAGLNGLLKVVELGTRYCLWHGPVPSIRVSVESIPV
ncbi:hypothetical protein [Pseudomonas sp. AN-1]|uniref:hypothetical protein n=1 Tax=Pseudomonas sp. AN-1 TaxID=3096605 RepID=UPI002A69B9C6|nr:hypothetical protein [Pseudomonas sp. AN-1]WPP44953.1 hypothetical protein SK095_17130 [Pseudomonas sp. AN-1]